MIAKLTRPRWIKPICHAVHWHLVKFLLMIIYHYGDVIMGTIASQITSLTIVYATVYSDADQRKHQSSASLAFVRGIHRGPVNSPHKWPVTRKMFPRDIKIHITCVVSRPFQRDMHPAYRSLNKAFTTEWKKYIHLQYNLLVILFPSRSKGIMNKQHIVLLKH